MPYVLSLPPTGVLLMTVSSGGVEGRPAGVAQRNPHSRGPRRRPGGITTLAPKGKATCSRGTVRKRSSKGLRPVRCGRCSALYRQPHGWHTAPGSARASLFSSEGQMATLTKDAARANISSALQHRHPAPSALPICLSGRDIYSSAIFAHQEQAMTDKPQLPAQYTLADPVQFAQNMAKVSRL